MKSYLELVKQYGRAHPQKDRFTIICIAIAVCLVTAVFSMAELGIQAEKAQVIQDYGHYHASFMGIDDETAAGIGSRIDVQHAGRMVEVESGFLQGKRLRIMGMDEEIAEAMNLEIVEGRYPQARNETMLDKRAMEQYQLSVGSKLAITLVDGTEREYTIVGSNADLSALKGTDSHGLILTVDSVRELGGRSAGAYYVAFKDRVKVHQSVAEIKRTFELTDKQVGVNERLLATMGQSKDNYFQQLYYIAGTLLILVLISSCIMITNSFNMNVLERTKFYGLLRCIGASKRQVRIMVLREGLRLSMRGIPIGLLAGIVITFICAALLKYLNSSVFGSMPVWQLSWIGIIAGSLIGFVTVLLSALAPARKASRVSPLQAISGHSAEQKARAVKKNGYAGKLRIEIAMGMSHASSSRKTLWLMIASFAVSIVLFMGFTVFIDFMHGALKPMKPSAPDVIVMDNSQQQSISAEALLEIQELPGVKLAYGRKWADVQASSADAGKQGVMSLISYESQQLSWAEKELVAGQLQTEEGDGALSVLVKIDSGFEVGDKLSIHTDQGERELIVSGVLPAIPSERKGDRVGVFVMEEQAFTTLTGIQEYGVLDLKLDKDAPDELIAQIRSQLPAEVEVQDKRQGNQEARSAFYTMAVFVYGFIVIIALISLFNIINSMNVSVASRTNQYGMMRAVGLSVKQMKRMVMTEATFFVISGCIVGGVLGTGVHYLFYKLLVTNQFGTVWSMPLGSLAIVIVVILIITIVSVRGPLRKLGQMDIVDVVNAR